MRKEKIVAIILAVGIGTGMFGNFEVKAAENNEPVKEVVVEAKETTGETPNVEGTTENGDKPEVPGISGDDTNVPTPPGGGQERPDVNPGNELEEVIKLTANNSTQKVGEKVDYNLLNAKAIDVNNPNHRYEIEIGAWEDTENSIYDFMNEEGVLVKSGVANVVIVAKKGTGKDAQIVAEIIKTITIVESNEVPVITGSGVTINQNQDFDLSQLNIKATDKEDGDLTSKVKIDSKVDVTKPGKYSVNASVEDSKGNKASNVFTVVVKEYKGPTISGVEGFKLKLNVGDKFDNSMLKVTAKDKDGKDLTNNVAFEGTVDTNKVGTYKVIAKVKDANKVNAKQEFVVEVVSKEVKPTKPVVKPVVKPAVKPVVKPAVKPNPEKPKTGDESTAGFLLSGIVALIGFIKMRK